MGMPVLVRLCRYLVIDFMASLPTIDSFTRQLIPFSPAVLRDITPPYDLVPRHTAS